MQAEHLELLLTREMPYGKYKGRVIADLPGHYLGWFAREGFPRGELGALLALMYELDHNDLRGLLLPLRARAPFPEIMAPSLFAELPLKKYFCTLLLALTCAAALAQAPAPKAAMPYAMQDTAVHHITSRELKREYEIAVSLPNGYHTSARRYPVLFVTDANYAFPIVRSLSKRVGDEGRGLEDFILVGLGYSTGDSPTFARRRDYTPAQPTEAGLTPDASGRPPQFGQAEAFRRFIAGDVFALIAQRYRADMARKVFAGHSYGSLLGLHILFTEASMFDQYILGSPSLWYAGGHMFEREKAYAAANRDLKARIFFAVGGEEVPTPENKDRNDMVGELKRFESILRARHYPNLRIESRVFDHEDHLTVAPALLTHGLKWTLPPAAKQPK